ncbi:Salicylate hydroxylase [Grifola frondosa]|uniref:Salicylate hydroxylase n=1 Tax=Grifola frondosa TaxID=5627 RepID=A0A1C7MBX8_GRIFR|nr:Salicylate hydroxylase [Grifola frondosa]
MTVHIVGVEALQFPYRGFDSDLCCCFRASVESLGLLVWYCITRYFALGSMLPNTDIRELRTSAAFNVAVVGAGLGGLMLALSLHKSAANVRVDIYESASQFTEIGAGIGMWPRVWELIKALGLEDQLLMIAGNTHHPETMHLRKSDHPEGFAYYTFNSNIDIMTFHRAELLTVLQSHLPLSFGVHFSKRLSTFDQPPSGSGPVNLHFQDGTSATCDVLIGCDGIKSAVRGCLYESLAAESELRGDSVQAAAFRNDVGPKWTGSIAYRGLLSRERLEQEYPGHRAIFSLMTYSGKNKARYLAHRAFF